MNNEVREEVVYIYLDDIIPNRFQPREVFDEKALKELAVSIKEHGVIQPIIVRKVNNKYEIIAGERRYKASALAGITKIPAIIRDLDDKESSKIALLENLQRKNLNPIEEARTYKKILELDEMTQEELAKTMGKSQSAVANKIRLLSLTDPVQDALLKEQISERHARTLLNIADPEQQAEMLKRVISEKLSVRKLEDEINKNVPKENNKGEIVNMNSSQNLIKPNFINDNPLTPTADMPAEEAEYGKVTIAPPDGMEMEYTPKYINYGEIDKENDKNEFTPNDIVKPVTTTDVVANTADINPGGETVTGNEAELDSMLNINKNYNFIPPSTNSNIPSTNNSSVPSSDEENGDYFENPDLKNMDLQNDINYNQAILNNPVNTTSNLTYAEEEKVEESYNTPSLIQKIKDMVKEYEEHGVKIEFDEMIFSENIQLMIKLEK